MRTSEEIIKDSPKIGNLIYEIQALEKQVEELKDELKNNKETRELTEKLRQMLIRDGLLDD